MTESIDIFKMNSEAAKRQSRLDDWIEETSKIAKSFCRTYISIDWEDLRQELCVWLVEKWEPLCEHNRSDQYIRECLSNTAKNYCAREMGTARHFSDQHVYTNEEARKAVEAWFAGTYDYVPEGAESVRGDDDITVACDVGLAFNKLTENSQNILRAKYFENDSFEGPRERQALKRAVDILTKKMNRQNSQQEYVGSKNADGGSVLV
jgi:DNA-directed RNA polymerase specialized sigma24 family protein